MTYELAKKLKDAEFPLSVCDEPDCHIPCHMPKTDKFCYYHLPTLSELIEACGDDFEALIRQAGGWGAITSRENYMMPNGNSCVGATPEEAVANLWLELNKK